MITSLLNIIIGALAFTASIIKKEYSRIYVIIVALLMTVIGIIGVVQGHRDEELIRKAIHRYGTIINWTDTEISITGRDLGKHKSSEYIAVLKIFPSKNPIINKLNIASTKGHSLNEIESIQIQDALSLMSLLSDSEGKIEAKEEFQNDIDTIYFFGKYESEADSIILRYKELFIHPHIYKSLSDLEENYLVLLIADQKNPAHRYYGWANLLLKTNIGKQIIPVGFKQLDQETKIIYNSPIRIVGGKVQKNRFD
jgi:hypothetical protein